MKIVNLETFRKMPAGILFSKYQPCIFEDIQIKGDTISVDFYTQRISDSIECSGGADLYDKLDDAKENGTELRIDLDSEGRDGCFEDDQLFAIWGRDDVINLINRLGKCLEAYKLPPI